MPEKPDRSAYELALAKWLKLDPSEIVAGSFELEPLPDGTTHVFWTVREQGPVPIRDTIVSTASLPVLHAVQAPGKSPQRPMRIPDDVWYPAVARAKAEGRPIGHVVTEMLRNYIAV